MGDKGAFTMRSIIYSVGLKGLYVVARFFVSLLENGRWGMPLGNTKGRLNKTDIYLKFACESRVGGGAEDARWAE